MPIIPLTDETKITQMVMQKTPRTTCLMVSGKFFDSWNFYLLEKKLKKKLRNKTKLTRSII